MNEIIIEAGSFEFLIIGPSGDGKNGLLLKSSSAKLDLLGYAKNAFENFENNKNSIVHGVTNLSHQCYKVCLSDFVSINLDEREHKLLLAYKINKSNKLLEEFHNIISYEFKTISNELNYALSLFNELRWKLDPLNKDSSSELYKRMDANKLYSSRLKGVEWHLSTLILIGKVLAENDEDIINKDNINFEAI